MERSRTYQNLANQLRTAQQRFVFDLMWQGKSNRAIVRIVEPDNRHRRNAYARIKTVERSLGVDVWEVAHQERAIAIRHYFRGWNRAESEIRAEKIRDYFQSPLFRRSQLVDLAIAISADTGCEWHQAVCGVEWLEARSLLKV